MAKWSKIVLSGSTDGIGIPVTGLTPSTGTVVHTGVTGSAGSIDQVIIYAFNTATTSSQLSITIGATTATGSRYEHTLVAGALAGLQPISPGLVVKNILTVKAYVTAVGRVNVFGWVDRYTT